MGVKKKKVSVVGLGYVGLPVALLASKKGFDVTGIDLDTQKIKKINEKFDPLNDEYVESHIKNTELVAVNNFNSISFSDIVIVCVPTPVKNDFQPDLGILSSACKSIAEKLSSKTLVIIESTINPGVCDEIVIPLIEKVSNKKLNKDFYISHCPERINPGDKKWNVENIPRVIGSSSKDGLDLTLEFYTQLIDADIKTMSTVKEAEAVKVVENSFRDINIAFVNELAMSFTKLGINVKNVIDGAATKPFAFMPHYPSVGVGGHCIPVDPYYLIEYARGFGFEHEFLSLARSINNHMPEYTAERLIDGLNEVKKALKGSYVTVLGVSYKANVADDRESPSYKIINILEERGAKVNVYDPYFPDKSDSSDLESALTRADAVVITTNHDVFNKLPKLYKSGVVIDGKNMFTKNHFHNPEVIYRGIGTF